MLSLRTNVDSFVVRWHSLTTLPARRPFSGVKKTAGTLGGAAGFSVTSRTQRVTMHTGNPNGSRKRRVYCGAGGATGKRTRDRELVGTCYDIDGVDDREPRRQMRQRGDLYRQTNAR